jgi:SCP-2 sterol transfer family
MLRYLAEAKTLEDVVLRALPALHDDLVTRRDGHDMSLKGMAERYEVAVTGDARYTISANRQSLTIAKGSRFDDIAKTTLIHMHVSESTAGYFLEQARNRMANVAEVPFALTDPRLLARLSSLQGVLKLAIVAKDKTAVTLHVAFGKAAGKDLEDLKADVSVEVAESLLPELAAGTLTPEQALSRTDAVSLQGSKLLAMQAALSFAPFFANATKGKGA